MRRIRLFSIADENEPMRISRLLREREVLAGWEEDFLNGWKSRKSL